MQIRLPSLKTQFIFLVYGKIRIKNSIEWDFQSKLIKSFTLIELLGNDLSFSSSCGFLHFVQIH